MREATKVERRPAYALGALLLVAVSSLLAGCAHTPQTHADYPGYESIEQIASSADLVVRVEYLDSVEDVIYPDLLSDPDPTTNPQAGLDENEREEARREGAVGVTVSRVEVVEVFKGEGTGVGEEIRVSQLGTREQPSAETTLLQSIPEGGSAVIFLRAWDKLPYDLLNPEQGMFIVSSDGEVTPLTQEPSFAAQNLDDLRAELK